MKIFRLFRVDDKTGISGTGYVATGFIYPSGKVTLEWRAPYRSIGIYNSIDDVMAVHGHDGSTEIRWVWGADPLDEDMDAAEHNR